MGLRLLPDNANYDYVGNRYIAFAIDGILLIASVVALFVYGLNLGIDFTGGVIVEVSSEKPIDVGVVRAKVTALGFGDVTPQLVGTEGKIVSIRLRPNEKTANQEKIAAQRIKTALGPDFSIRRIDTVGPKVSGELYFNGILATVLAVVMIAVYVAFRFEWQYGVAAMVSTAHDVMMGVGLYALFQLDFNLTSIGALLTLAGYSINDTVVVFDRIRENRRKYKRMPLGDLINLSTNQTLSRTIVTSLTTILALIPLIAFGGEALFGFSVTILWGVIVGTYSSIFVASALLLYMPDIDTGASKSAGKPAEA